MRKLYVGYNTLKEICLKSLKAISIGRQRLYDFEDVTEVLNQLKDVSSI